MFLHIFAKTSIQHIKIWCLRPVHAHMAWYRTWIEVDDQRNSRLRIWTLEKEEKPRENRKQNLTHHGETERVRHENKEEKQKRWQKREKLQSLWVDCSFIVICSLCFIYFFHHTTCVNTCDTLASSAANQGDKTVSVAQGGTATPGATINVNWPF